LRTQQSAISQPLAISKESSDIVSFLWLNADGCFPQIVNRQFCGGAREMLRA